MLAVVGDSMPRLAPLLVAAWGCSEERSFHGSLEVLGAGAPARVEVGSGIGRDRVAIPVTVVNDLGVPVRGTTVDLEVSGACADGTPISLEESTIAIDASGHGRAYAIAPCSTVFAVRATGSGDGAALGATVRSYALANVAPIFQMATAAELPPEVRAPALVAAGTAGIALGTATEVWWQSASSGQLPVRVLSLDTPLVGMQSAHVDADGVRDLVAWSSAFVVLLRGVDGGGYTWQDGFQVGDERAITGVAAQDLDGDRLVDLAVATAGDGDGTVEIVSGDGAWAWRTTDVLDTSFPVAGVTAGDDDRDGRAEVTVLDADRGWLQRWTQSDAGWLEGAPAELLDPTEEGDQPYSAPDGSVLMPMADLDHDGRKDIIVNEAPGSGIQRLVFFVLGDDGVTFFQETYDAYFASVTDMNQDGADDLLALEDDVLHIIRNDAATGRFTSQGVAGVGLAAPMTSGDLDGDTIADVAIVRDDAAFFTGVLVEDDGGALWQVRDWGATSFQVGFTGPHVVADTTGDGLADVVGFSSSTAGATVLRNWTVAIHEGEMAMSTIGTSVAFELGEDVTPYDIAHCGDRYYALAGTGSAAELVRVSANSGLVRIGSNAEVTGTLLACGSLGEASVVVATADGAWTSYDDTLTAIATGDVKPTGAVAIADPDGDGTSVVLSCGPAPCSIAVADVDGDGLDEIARSSPTGLSIEGWATTEELPGNGSLSTADVDRDGFVDFLATDPDGRLLVFRGVKGGLAPALAYHPDGRVAGSADAFDTTGDGVPEILLEGLNGTLSITAPSTLPAN
jgi:hypothetical protein